MAPTTTTTTNGTRTFKKKRSTKCRKLVERSQAQNMLRNVAFTAEELFAFVRDVLLLPEDTCLELKDVDFSEAGDDDFVSLTAISKEKDPLPIAINPSVLKKYGDKYANVLTADELQWFFMRALKHNASMKVIVNSKVINYVLYEWMESRQWKLKD